MIKMDFYNTYMRFWYLSHYRATKAQTSLRKCADSPEPSLLAYSRFGCRRRLGHKFSHLPLLDMSIRVLYSGGSLDAKTRCKNQAVNFFTPCNSVADLEGLRWFGSLEHPLPNPRFEISYENEIIWSQ